MKKQFNHIWTLVVAGTVAASALIGCQDTDYPTPQPATGPSTSTARFLFVNAAPGTPALNFLVENTPVAENIAFGQSSSYVTVPSGTLQVRAKAASGTIGGILGSSDVLYRAGATNQNNFAATANASYTVFVTDTLNRPKPTTLNATNPGGPQFLVISDVLTAPAAGNAGVRFFNLVPSSSAVTVLVKQNDQTVATFASRAYRATSSGSGTSAVDFTRFTAIPAGTYTVEAHLGSATGPTILTLPNVPAAAGKLYTVYAKGLVNGTGANALSAGVILNN